MLIKKKHNVLYLFSEELNLFHILPRATCLQHLIGSSITMCDLETDLLLFLRNISIE